MTIRERSFTRRWISRLGAVLFGLAFAWLLLEIVLRVGYAVLPPRIQSALRDVQKTPFTDSRIVAPPVWRTDISYLTITEPNVTNLEQAGSPTVKFHVTTKPMFDPNSHVGFRVPSANWEPRWPIDAVVVGDSFSFCFVEYKDCWVNRLTTDYNLSVINLGQPVTGSVSHLRLLKTFGLTAEAPLVIWQWYGNDYNDDYGLAVLNGEISNDTPETPRTIPESDSAILRWLRRHSAVYVTLDTVTRSEEELTGITMFVDPYRIREGDLDLAFGQSYVRDAFDMTNPKNQEGFRRSQAALLETRDMLTEHDAKLVVVLIPSKEEVYRRWTEPKLGENALALLSAGREMMLDFCQQEDLTCLDMLPLFEPYANDGEQLYWPTDPHLNENGNQQLAKFVWNAINELGLLPQ